MKQVQLTQGKVALVDDEDFELVSNYNWCIHTRKGLYYAVSGGWDKDLKKEYVIRMHRLILGLNGRLPFVDHIDRNGLNNQRSNLRLATALQNCANSSNRTMINKTSKYRGVYWCRFKNKWFPRINENGKNKYFRGCLTEIEAALIFNENAKRIYGEFAVLNIIE